MDSIGGRNHLSLFSESSEKSLFASKDNLHSSLPREEAEEKENNASLERQCSNDRSMRNRLISQYHAGEGGPLQKIREELGADSHDSEEGNLDAWRDSPKHRFSLEDRPLAREDDLFKIQHKQSLAQMGILPPEDNPLNMPPGFALQGLFDLAPGDNTGVDRRKRLHSESESGIDEEALGFGMTGKRTNIGKDKNDWVLAEVIFGNYAYDLSTQILKNNGEPVALNYSERSLLHAFASCPNQELSFEQLVKLMNQKNDIALSTFWKRLGNLRQVLELDQEQTFLTHMSGPENKDGKATYLFQPDDVVETCCRDDQLLVRQPDPQWSVDYKGFRFHLDRNHAIEAGTGRKILLTPLEANIFRMLHDRAVGESDSWAILPRALYDMALSSGKGVSATQKTHAIAKHICAFNEKFRSAGSNDNIIRHKKAGKRGGKGELENGYFLDIARLADRKRLPAGKPPGYSAPLCVASNAGTAFKGRIQSLHFGPDLAYHVGKRRFERNGERAEMAGYADSGGGTRHITDHHLGIIDTFAQDPRKALSLRDIAAEIQRLKSKEMSAASVETAIRQINQVFKVNDQGKAISYDAGKKGYQLNITGVSAQDDIEDQAPRDFAMIRFAGACMIDVEQRTLRIGDMTVSLNAAVEDKSQGLDAPSLWLLLLLARHPNRALSIDRIIADAKRENISINAEKTVRNKVGTIRKYFKQFDVNIPIKAPYGESGYTFEGDPAN